MNFEEGKNNIGTVTKQIEGSKDAEESKSSGIDEEMEYSIIDMNEENRTQEGDDEAVGVMLNTMACGIQDKMASEIQNKTASGIQDTVACGIQDTMTSGIHDMTPGCSGEEKNSIEMDESKSEESEILQAMTGSTVDAMRPLELEIEKPEGPEVLTCGSEDEMRLVMSGKYEVPNDGNNQISAKTYKIYFSEKQGLKVVKEHEATTSAESNGESNEAEEEQSSPGSNPYGCRTISSFTPRERIKIQERAKQIYHAAEFKSFDEFKGPFDAYRIYGNHPYRVASSEKFRDGKNNLDKRYQYKYIVFHCAHFGKARKRGEGIRKKQNYLPSGCTAMLRLNAHPAEGCLRISSFKPDHNGHEHSEQDYLRIVSKQRKGGSGRSKANRKARTSRKSAKTAETVQSSSESEVIKTDGTDEKMDTEPIVNSAVNLPEVEMSEPEENVPIDLSGVRRTEPENIPSRLPSEYLSAFQQLQQPTVSGNPVYPNLVANQQEANAARNLGNLYSLIRNANELLLIDLFRQQYINQQVNIGYLREAQQYLDPNLCTHFSFMLCGGEFQLSDWSDTQLKDLTAVLQQSPEALIEKGSITGITVNDIQGIHFESIGRALDAVRAEKLKRVGEIFEEAAQEVLNAIKQPYFSKRLQEFEELVAFMKSFNVDNPSVS